MSKPGTSSAAYAAQGNEDSLGLAVTDYTGPYKQLWHLLLGTTDIASNDVVHEELIQRCNTIISGLIYYDSPTPIEIPTVTETSSKKYRLKIELMKTLNVSESVALELLSSFLVYEYKGVVNPLGDLLLNDLAIKGFAQDVSDFYMRERLCVLYCAQAILSGATDGKHPFSVIFSAFIAAASMSDWCKWLCQSLKKIKNDEERVQILHTLCILLHNYGEFKGVITEFNEGFTFGKRSTSIMYAEAVLMYVFIQCGPSSSDSAIEAFISKHIKEMDENPFMYGALLGAYVVRCPNNEELRAVTRRSHHPEKCAANMSLLLTEYCEHSFRNKHGLTSLIYKCIYGISETILSRFDKNNFGTVDEWNQLLLTLLGDPETARMFMLEQPEELTLLYTEALMCLPVEVEWSLNFWAATCRTATVDVSPRSILERITEINALANVFEGDESHVLRPNGNGQWILLRDINIGGVIVPAGTTGQTVKEQPSLMITWELDSPARNLTIWDVLLNVVIRKAYEEYPNFVKQTLSQVCAIARFIAQFNKSSTEAPESIINLYKPIIVILQRILEDLHDSQLKSMYVALLLDVVRAGSVHSIELLLNNDEPALWPTPDSTNQVAETILAYESVLNSDYSVTKTFLKNMIDLFEGEKDIVPYFPHNLFGRSILEIDNPKMIPHAGSLRTLYANAITFIVENIYPSFVRWRMNRPSDQFEIIQDTFRVLRTLFRFKDPSFTPLKYNCCIAILAPGNSLLAVLTTDSDQLEDAWIRPSKDNQFLDQTMYYALSLLICLADFDVRTLKMLDNSSNLTLVKKLGKLVRHRLNPTLPTLAIDVLRKMALHLNISVLACFGDGIDSFRDLLQQRLEYRTEAAKLKVSILEFLTVCAQTQPGLIQHFFQDENSATCLLELLSEKDPNVPVSALCLVRALIRKSSAVFKNRGAELWVDAMKPIQALDSFPSIISKQKIISYTMNILSFEIFRAAAIEKEFSNVLNELLRQENILKLLQLASETRQIQETKKCVYAIKHFLTLLLARPDHENFLADEIRQLCLNAVTDYFWNCLELEENEELLPAFAELMSVLGPSSDPMYLERLSSGLPQSFKTVTLRVQVPLLTLIHKSIGIINSDISLVTIESLVRILADIFYHAAKIYDSISIYLVRPLLGVAASIMYAIIASPYCKDWANIFKQRMIVSSIVSVAHVGIQRGEAPEIVQDALGSLIRLSRYPGTADMLRNVSFSTEIYLPLSQYSAPESTDEKWFEVYMLCCDLNSAMMEAGHFYFLEESLNFWTIHGEFVIVKLFALTQLINHCYLQTPDQNFQTIKQLLSFVVVAFHGISIMIPYFQQWRLQQRQTLLKLMQGVLATLETSVSLLSQPNHLLLVITKSTKGSSTTTSPAFKLTPQLLEVQTKLWEVVAMGVHLYLKIGKNETEFISRDKILPLLFSIIGLCGRVMSKHADKKSHPVVNVTSEVTMSLEKGLTLLLHHVIGMIRTQDRSNKDELAFIRETSSEINSLCDMVRRLGLPPDDFAIQISSALEENIKEMLCK